MIESSNTPYGDWEQIYRDLGYWPRPLEGKRPIDKNWQLPDSDIPAETFERWKKLGHKNIGLVAGSPFPDGTRLGFLDIDNDNYTNLALSAMGNPKCARLGKKGIVLPFRYPIGFTTAKKMRVKGKSNEALGEVAEFLLEGSQCVIPPSIHPDTGRPYEWIGTPLHEMNFNHLPVIGE